MLFLCHFFSVLYSAGATGVSEVCCCLSRRSKRVAWPHMGYVAWRMTTSRPHHVFLFSRGVDLNAVASFVVHGTEGSCAPAVRMVSVCVVMCPAAYSLPLRTHGSRRVPPPQSRWWSSTRKRSPEAVAVLATPRVGPVSAGLFVFPPCSLNRLLSCAVGIRRLCRVVSARRRGA